MVCNLSILPISHSSFTPSELVLAKQSALVWPVRQHLEHFLLEAEEFVLVFDGGLRNFANLRSRESSSDRNSEVKADLTFGLRAKAFAAFLHRSAMSWEMSWYCPLSRRSAADSNTSKVPGLPFRELRRCICRC